MENVIYCFFLFFSSGSTTRRFNVVKTGMTITLLSDWYDPIDEFVDQRSFDTFRFSLFLYPSFLDSVMTFSSFCLTTYLEGSESFEEEKPLSSLIRSQTTRPTSSKSS